MTPPPDLTPFAVVVAIAGGLLGPQMAYYVGAYALIFLGWFFGLLYGLWVRPVDSRMPMWAYTVVTFGASIFTTVTVAEVASNYVPFAPTTLLFPIALAIPAMPDKWGIVGSWLLKMWEAARGVKQ